ncbi:MAG: hypothetical protein EXR76_11820 [Myxococcales bacterium]|nr:hypothetical protein [Myxococcales bacterium]
MVHRLYHLAIALGLFGAPLACGPQITAELASEASSALFWVGDWTVDGLALDADPAFAALSPEARSTVRLLIDGQGLRLAVDSRSVHLGSGPRSAIVSATEEPERVRLILKDGTQLTLERRLGSGLFWVERALPLKRIP